LETIPAKQASAETKQVSTKKQTAETAKLTKTKSKTASKSANSGG
jgi:hypothetical protein